MIDNRHEELEISAINFPSKRIARVTLSRVSALLFKLTIQILRSSQGGYRAVKPRQVYCFLCARVTLISKPRHLLVYRKSKKLVCRKALTRHLISIEEGTY